MNLKSLLAPALSLAVLATTGAAFAQNGYPQGPPPQGYQQGPGGPGGFDQAPPQFREAQRRGYHDGVEGARRDFENHRSPNVNNRDEFRHPPVAGPDRRDYRFGFRKGYDNAVRHMFGHGPR